MLVLYLCPVDQIWQVVRSNTYQSSRSPQRIHRSQLHVPAILPLQVVRAVRPELLLSYPVWPVQSPQPRAAWVSDVSAACSAGPANSDPSFARRYHRQELLRDHVTVRVEQESRSRVSPTGAISTARWNSRRRLEGIVRCQCLPSDQPSQPRGADARDNMVRDGVTCRMIT